MGQNKDHFDLSTIKFQSSTIIFRSSRFYEILKLQIDYF